MQRVHTTRRQALGITSGLGAALLGHSLLADEAVTTSDPEPLYLHWMVPPFYDQNGNLERPATRIVSTLVTLSHDFDVAIGEDEVRIRGRIEPVGEQFVVDLHATYATGTLFFGGKVEPERIFDAYGGVFGSGIFSTRCVLSRSPDCNEFLKRQLDGYDEYRPERCTSE